MMHAFAVFLMSDANLRSVLHCMKCKGQYSVSLLQMRVGCFCKRSASETQKYINSVLIDPGIEEETRFNK
jgi:hypothetical protein